MKRVATSTMGLVALVAMLVLGMLSAESASAQLFLYTGPLPGLILFLNDNNQIFEVAAGFTVVCRHFGGHGILSSTSMKEESQTITGTYSKCEATGGLPTTVTPIEYKIGANGSVAVLKSIVLTVGGAAKCSLKVNSGGANSELLKLSFLNRPGGDILIHSEVTGIHSIPSGGQCGEAGIEKGNGTYTGLILVWADKGGTITWDAFP